MSTSGGSRPTHVPVSASSPSALSGTAGCSEVLRKHDLLKPLSTKREVEVFLRAIHKEFVASVEPAESGLQDVFLQRGVLTETDNESLTGSHLPVCRDKARHLFKTLYSISHDVFVRDALPALCDKYDYIIPACFWKADVIVEAMSSELAQRETRGGKEEAEGTAASTRSWGKSSRATEERSDGVVCMRCMIRTRLRPTAVADFLFRHWAVSFVVYCDLTKDHRLTLANWPALFSSFTSLPSDDGKGHLPEMTSLLESHSLPVPRNLLTMMTKGFPCRCRHNADCVRFPSVTRKKREKWCQYLKRLIEQQTVDSSDQSSDSLYPASTADGGNSSSSNIGSTSASSGSGWQYHGPKSSKPGTADCPNGAQEAGTTSGTVRPSFPKDSTDSGLVEPPVNIANDSNTVPDADHSATDNCFLPNSGMGCIDEVVEARMLQIVHLLDESCPESLERDYYATLNLRNRSSSLEDDQNKRKTWHGLPPRKHESEDMFRPQLQDAPAERSSSLTSLLLKKLEDARSLNDAEGTVECGTENCAHDAFDELDSPAVVGTSNVSDRSIDESQSGAKALEPGSGVESSGSVCNKESKGITTNIQTTGSSGTKGSNTKPLPPALKHRPKQGKVAKLAARYQSAPAPVNVPRTYLQHTQPRGINKDRSAADPAGNPTQQTRNSAMPRDTAVGASKESDRDSTLQQPLHHNQHAHTSSRSGSLAEGALSEDGDPNSKPTREVKHLTSPPLQTKGKDAVMPTRCSDFKFTSLSSLLPAGGSPDNEKYKQVQKAIRKGYYEKIHSAVPDLPHDCQHQGVGTHWTAVSELPEAVTFVSQPNSPDHQRQSREPGKPNHGRLLWEAIDDIRGNRDLQDFISFASREAGDDEGLRLLFRKAVITDVKAREEISQLLESHAQMASTFGEIRHKRQETHLPDPDDDRTHPPHPAGSSDPVSSPPDVVCEVSRLLSQVEWLCGEMVIFTKVYLLCALYLHTSPKLTTESSSTQAMAVIRDVIMLSEWTSLQGWRVIVQVDELKAGLPEEDGISQRVDEVVALIKAFLEHA